VTKLTSKTFVAELGEVRLAPETGPRLGDRLDEETRRRLERLRRGE
jgi:hypothetical protein